MLLLEYELHAGVGAGGHGEVSKKPFYLHVGCLASSRASQIYTSYWYLFKYLV